MFEVRDYAGSYRQGGFVSQVEAVRHAQDKVKETGHTYVVYELVTVELVRGKK
jgi:hypothetical protein